MNGLVVVYIGEESSEIQSRRQLEWRGRDWLLSFSLLLLFFFFFLCTVLVGDDFCGGNFDG